MITIEAYRAAIGNFNGTAQLGLKHVWKDMTVGSNLSRESLSRLFKLTPFCAIFVYVSFALLLAGDIESNPGPYNLDKVVNGSFHQGDSRFGFTAGSQCMCNALWAICYSKIKCVRFWTEWDLNRILGLGNDLYGTLGYTDQYLSLNDLPNLINVNCVEIKIEKRDSRLAELSIDSRNFLRVDENANGGVLVAGGFGTSFISYNGVVYVFDSHSRDLQGLPHPSGTSVLLKFRSVNDAEAYVKHLYLSFFQNETLFFEMQNFIVDISDEVKAELKTMFQKDKKNSSERKRRLSSKFKEGECSSKAKQRANLSNEQRENLQEKNRQGMASLRKNLSNEQRENLKEKNRQGMASLRANLSNEQRENLQEKNRQGMASLRKNLSNKQRENLKEKNRQGMASLRANLSNEQRKNLQEKDSLSKASWRENSKSIAAFKKHINKGPYHVCVVCNRSLYLTSVLLFFEYKYDVCGSVFQSRVLSFDNKEYICKTCHSKLLKNKIPCQAVCNDLKVIELPERFSDIRKLEKIIISKRLLFKKVYVLVQKYFYPIQCVSQKFVPFVKTQRKCVSLNTFASHR